MGLPDVHEVEGGSMTSKKALGRIIRIASNPSDSRVYILVLANINDVHDFTLGRVSISQEKKGDNK